MEINRSGGQSTRVVEVLQSGAFCTYRAFEPVRGYHTKLIPVRTTSLTNPDLKDPATVGCIASLARSAWADPTASAGYWMPKASAQVRPSDDLWRSGWWRVVATDTSRKTHRFDAATEGEAWALALLGAP